MFGISHFPEIVLLLVIALIIFGPKRLPEVGAGLGKSIREFRKATSELQDSVMGQQDAGASSTRPYIAAPDVAAAPPAAAAHAASTLQSEQEPAHL